MEVTFYDAQGDPVAYTEDMKTIYLFSGEPVAYLVDSSVYSFSGKHLGRFENGWIRDNYGNCVFFTDEAQEGGPTKPPPCTKPAKDLKHIRPLKESRARQSLAVSKTSSWSKRSGPQFFTGG